MDLLDRLLGHDRWTTARLLDLGRDLSDAELDQEFDIGRCTLRKTLDHMIFNVAAWTGVMTGQPPDDERDTSSVDAFLARHERNYDAFASLARTLQENGRLDDTFVDRHGVTQSFGGTIIQIILHNHGHRTEILHILQRLGVENLPDGDPQEWEHMTGRITRQG
jgi:uncharacterized damage-inducible protein DinB